MGTTRLPAQNPTHTFPYPPAISSALGLSGNSIGEGPLDSQTLPVTPHPLQARVTGEAETAALISGQGQRVVCPLVKGNNNRKEGSQTLKLAYRRFPDSCTTAQDPFFIHQEG